MGRVMLDLDDRTLARAAAVAEARRVPVEAVLADRLADAAWGRLPDLHNPSHRGLMAALDRPIEAGRAGSHDREHERAALYAENRRRLVELIDATSGDMGTRRWNRASLYGR